MIAILGDTHLPRGERRLPESCVRVLAMADLIVHVGDFTSAAVLHELEQLAPVAAVHGNVDEWSLREALPARRVAEAEGMRIGLVHDAGPRNGRHARLLGWFRDCQIVAYGHTHWPEVVRHEAAWVVNPGSPTERRRAPGHTMVVVRDGEPVLVSLD